MDVFKKQSAEVIEYSFDYALSLNPGDALTTTVMVEIRNIAGVVPGDSLPTIIKTVVNSPAAAINVLIAGGRAVNVYEISCLATTVKGERLKLQFKLVVREI
jgi:hypothetical protein